MMKKRNALGRIAGLLITVLLLAPIVGACTSTTATPASGPSGAPTEESAPEPTETAALEPTEPAAPEPTEVEAAVVSQELIYAMGSEPPGLDPHAVLGGQGLRLFQNVYEGFARHRTGTSELIPTLAESWELSNDGLTYTLHLRQGVKFHDGTEFNADAAKINIDRILTLGQGPSTFLVDLDSVEVVDDYTVNLNLKNVNVFFEQYFPFIYMISPTAIEEHTEGDDNATAWLSANIVGTGPYMLESFAQGEQTVLTAFPDYWGGWEGPHLDRIVMRMVPEPATQRLLLENGEVQMIDSVSPTDADALDAVDGVQVTVSPGLRVDMLSLNERFEPLADINVRKAIQYAYPYEEVIRVANFGLTQPGAGPLSVNFEGVGSDQIEQWHQDMDMARQFLAQSNYPDGGFTLRLNYHPTFPEQRTAGLLLADALSELNITVEVSEMQFGQMIEAMASENQDVMPHMVLLRFSPVTGDPIFNLRQIFHSSNAGGAWNWSFYENERVDELIDNAKTELDEQARLDQLVEIQKTVVDEAAYVYVQEAVELDAFVDNLVGYVYNPFNYSWDVYFYELHFE